MKFKERDKDFKTSQALHIHMRKIHETIPQCDGMELSLNVENGNSTDISIDVDSDDGVKKPGEDEFISENVENVNENFTWIELGIIAHSEKIATKIVKINFEKFTDINFMWSSTKEQKEKVKKQNTYTYWSCEIDNVKSKVEIEEIKKTWNKIEHTSSELIYMIYK